MGFLSSILGTIKSKTTSDGRGVRTRITGVKEGKKGKHETAWSNWSAENGTYNEGWHGENYEKK